VASLLWTAGLLALMHMISLTVVHVFPNTTTLGITWPVLLGVVLMIAGFSGLRGGLTPFRQLRTRLAAVRAGQERQVDGEYPNEVQPLVNDLNALLEDRERAVKRALSTAGDLAHGLKTPLAILAQEAERAGAAGECITQQVQRMRRQVDYHLARARAAASGAVFAARCPLAPAADGIVRALLKLHAARALEIEAGISPDLIVRAQKEDVEEMLGNLLDNACKWAKSGVAVAATQMDATIVITVDDDGPGLAAPLRTVVLQRGVRADEAAPGSGLGLAIVRDLAELYGGSISLGDSPRGGLRARLALPAGDAQSREGVSN
jgi:signal transduction histidine kinase